MRMGSSWCCSGVLGNACGRGERIRCVPWHDVTVRAQKEQRTVLVVRWAWASGSYQGVDAWEVMEMKFIAKGAWEGKKPRVLGGIGLAAWLGFEAEGNCRW